MLLISLAASGQSFSRLELGGTASSCLDCVLNRGAVGPEVTFNFNRYIALNGTASFSAKAINTFTDTSGGRSMEVFLGPSFAARGSRVTFFAKAQPGIVHWSRTIRGIEESGTAVNQPLTFSYGPRNFFGIKLGGGAQYFITPRFSVKAELGDVLVRSVNTTGVAQYGSNVQIAAGATYELGKLRSFERKNATSHRFLDAGNVLLLTASLLAQTADDVTTQRLQADCRRINTSMSSSFPCSQEEGDPLFRPFVTHGWGGQIAISTIVTSAEVALMYTLHRMGYHIVERSIPAAQATASSVAAYRNLHDAALTKHF